MKYNLYDFDGTVYDGDSSVDFFKYCVKKNPQIKKMYFKILVNFLKYKTKIITITEFKEYIFSFVQYFDNLEILINEFWQLNEIKIKDFYLKKDHSKDIIISASPYFLLEPICTKLKVKDLIASDVDIKTGHFNKPNNRGEIKVQEFRKKYPKVIINEMYSDSMHDKPLLDLAKHGYFVKKNIIIPYNEYKPNIIKRIWNKIWEIYHNKEEVWNYLIIGGLTTLVSIGSFAIFSKIIKTSLLVSNTISWLLAVLFAYFTNRTFVFHSKNNKRHELISFITARIITLLLDTDLMILLVKVLYLDELIAKLLVQVIILITNYLISKIIVFKNKTT